MQTGKAKARRGGGQARRRARCSAAATSHHRPTSRKSQRTPTVPRRAWMWTGNGRRSGSDRSDGPRGPEPASHRRAGRSGRRRAGRRRPRPPPRATAAGPRPPRPLRREEEERPRMPEASARRCPPPNPAFAEAARRGLRSRRARRSAPGLLEHERRPLPRSPSTPEAAAEARREGEGAGVEPVRQHQDDTDAERGPRPNGWRVKSHSTIGTGRKRRAPATRSPAGVGLRPAGRGSTRDCYHRSATRANPSGWGRAGART